MIDINGYNLVRADHPDNIKRGGICINYNESIKNFPLPYPALIKTLPYFKVVFFLEISTTIKRL